jgi:DivIVA domain-containing protein
MPLTPEDVQNKRFTTTRFRPGYDEDEVDGFLDEVEAELTRLVQENKSLAARAASAAAAPPPPPPTPTAPAEAAPAEAPEGGQDAALRTLLLAQRTADEAIAQARKEAEQIVGEARTRATGLEQEAQQRHAAAMTEFERRRRELERQVEDLRAFEREYRTRLKAYLETQLRELSGRGVAADGPGGSEPAPVSQPTSTAGRPASPFGPAPTIARSGESTTTTEQGPSPSGPPREAEHPDAAEADARTGVEVDEGPEVPPSTG